MIREKLKNIQDYTSSLYNLKLSNFEDSFNLLFELEKIPEIENLSTPIVYDRKTFGEATTLNFTADVFYDSERSETVYTLFFPRNKLITEFRWYTKYLVNRADLYIKRYKPKSEYVCASYSGFPTHHSSFNVPFISRDETSKEELETITIRFKSKKEINVDITCIGCDFLYIKGLCYCFGYDSKNLYDKEKKQFIWSVLKLLEVPYYKEEDDKRLKVPNNVISYN